MNPLATATAESIVASLDDARLLDCALGDDEEVKQYIAKDIQITLVVALSDPLVLLRAAQSLLDSGASVVPGLKLHEEINHYLEAHPRG